MDKNLDDSLLSDDGDDVYYANARAEHKSFPTLDEMLDDKTMILAKHFTTKWKDLREAIPIFKTTLYPLEEDAYVKRAILKTMGNMAEYIHLQHYDMDDEDQYVSRIAWETLCECFDFVMGV